MLFFIRFLYCFSCLRFKMLIFLFYNFILVETVFRILFEQGLYDWEMQEFIFLIDILVVVYFFNNEDIRVQIGDYLGIFFSKLVLVYFSLVLVYFLFLIVNLIWKQQMFFMDRVLVWILLLGRININDMNQKRRLRLVIFLDVCMMCFVDREI